MHNEVSFPLHAACGAAYLTAPNIAARHAFSTRLGGMSTGVLESLNLSVRRGDTPENVRENWRRLGTAAGLDLTRAVYARQVHSADVRIAHAADAQPPEMEPRFTCDGFVTNEPGVPLAVFMADCLPALLHDCAVATALPVHPASTLYDNALNESLSYDLDKAKKLFDDLKIVDYDGDGEREYIPDGQSPLDISLSLIVYADSTAKVSMANKIAADLTSIGIPVKVRELSWDNYQAALQGGKYDMYYGEVALPADFDLSALLKAGGSLNYGGITTGTYADVINAYLAASDADRAAACRTMLQTISDTAPIVPVCFEKHCLYVHRGAVGGFAPTKYNIFRNIADWKINNA